MYYLATLFNRIIDLVNPGKSRFFTSMHYLFEEDKNVCACEPNTSPLFYVLGLSSAMMISVSVNSIFKSFRENTTPSIFDTDIFQEKHYVVRNSPKLDPYSMQMLLDSDSSGLDSESDESESEEEKFANIPLTQ